MSVTTIPQHVRWGPNDERPAGISIIGENGVESTFMRWNDLQSELEHKLMPQLFAKPEGFRFQARETIRTNPTGWCKLLMGEESGFATSGSAATQITAGLSTDSCM